MDVLPSRILLLTDSPLFAGTERHMFELARALRPLVQEISVACPDDGQLAQRSSAEGIPYLSLAPRSLLDRPYVLALSRLLKSGRIDLLHAHNGRCCLQATLAVRHAGRGRCIFTQHFLEPDHTTRWGLSGMLSHGAHRLVNRSIDRIIAVSNAARDRMVRRGDAPAWKIEAIPNGIPAPRLEQLPPPEAVRRELCIASEALLVSCVARLEREKDLPTLIRAMASLIPSLPQARCVIAGDGDERSALQRLIQDTGLENHVRLLGFREDPLAIVNASDLFILPSRAEPFGLAILEAMALGKAVIATRDGGPVEIVSERETGLLVTPGEPQEMTDAMLALLQNADLRAKMGRQGSIRFAQRYTSARMALATAGVYHRTLAG